MYEDFDDEEKVTPQEALDNFYHHCMEYVSMYDYEEYDLPTREELIDGQILELDCEVCTFREKCDKMCCLANSEEMQKRFQILKDLQPGKFTAFTVVAAYEIWGKVMTQMGGFKCPKDDPNYELIKKIERLSSENDSGVYWNLDEALARIFYPEYRRIYFY